MNPLYHQVFNVRISDMDGNSILLLCGRQSVSWEHLSIFLFSNLREVYQKVLEKSFTLRRHD